MVLSKSCIYGIQSAIYVAAQPSSAYVPIAQIADKLNISFHFLTKVLQQFTEAGIFLSYRGPRGGVQLALSASNITLRDMIVAIDGPGIFTECLLGVHGCGSEEPCPVHDTWMQIRADLTQVAETTTLTMLADKAYELRMRLVQNLAAALENS